MLRRVSKEKDEIIVQLKRDMTRRMPFGVVLLTGKKRIWSVARNKRPVPSSNESESARMKRSTG
jgi:hypothetical protein